MGFFEEDIQSEKSESRVRNGSCILSKEVGANKFKVLGEETKGKKGGEAFLDNVRHVVNERVDFEMKMKKK